MKKQSLKNIENIFDQAQKLRIFVFSVAQTAAWGSIFQLDLLALEIWHFAPSWAAQAQGLQLYLSQKPLVLACGLQDISIRQNRVANDDEMWSDLLTQSTPLRKLPL